MNPLGKNVPQDENLPTCALSGIEPPTYHMLKSQHSIMHQRSEFQLSIMFCTFPTEHGTQGLALHVTKPFKHDSILKYYLFLSDKVVFSISTYFLQSSKPKI